MYVDDFGYHVDIGVFDITVRACIRVGGVELFTKRSWVFDNADDFNTLGSFIVDCCELFIESRAYRKCLKNKPQMYRIFYSKPRCLNNSMRVCVMQ